MKRRTLLKQTGIVALAYSLPYPALSITKSEKMKNRNKYDTIIVGGSYSGLSAAMALGRALRNVLIIDSGIPCNRHTPHSHNFITQDGEKPGKIAQKAKEQVLKYNTINMLEDTAIKGVKNESGFDIHTATGKVFGAKKLLFATGIKDILPEIEGFAACWGKSIIHCPYCHGYEVRGKTTGILANGDVAFHLAQLVSNWTKDLTIFCNGTSTLTETQTAKLYQHGIQVIEKEIDRLTHDSGSIRHITFKDKKQYALDAVYARPAFEQHCKIPHDLGCEYTEQGFLFVNSFQKTNVPGIYACGDNTTGMRSVANAVAMGSMAGAMLNSDLITEDF